VIPINLYFVLLLQDQNQNKLISQWVHTHFILDHNLSKQQQQLNSFHRKNSQATNNNNNTKTKFSRKKNQ